MMTFDVYAATRRLQNELASQGYSEWADRLGDAVDSGSTGSEILMAIRWTLLQIKNDLPDARPMDREIIEDLLSAIDSALR
jgi:hypothetical protein